MEAARQTSVRRRIGGNMPDNRPNLQIAQPHIEGYETADKNGWPTPLVDPSSPLKMKVTNGSNGEQKNIQAMSTSSKGELSLAEGSSDIKTGDMLAQGGHKNKLQTSQQNVDEHSTIESGD